jgi:predicted dehydrogenase
MAFMGREFRVVIIGVGGMAELYAQALVEVPGVRLVGGSCRTQSRGEAFAGRFKCEWFGDYERMLDATRPDAALVCTPSAMHLDPTLACAKRRVHVLCTKPLEITAARCRTMVRAAEEAGVALAGLFPERFKRATATVHRIISEGRLGPIALINAQTPWWREDSYYDGHWHGTLAIDGGGALINQAIHGVDTMQWLAAASMPGFPAERNPVESVVAMTARRSHDERVMDAEDTAVAVVRFHNGALGNIVATTSQYPGAFRKLTVGGRDGTVEIEEDDLSRMDLRHERPGDAVLRESSRGANLLSGKSDPLAIDYGHERRQFEAIFAAIAENRAVPIPGREAAKAVEIVEAIYRSADEGRVVRLQEVIEDGESA